MPCLLTGSASLTVLILICVQISTFVKDYPNALARAKAFDAQVDADAKKVSDDYASVVALSIRQGFGATEITVSKNGDGSFDTSNTLTFMKEISSSGVWTVLLSPGDLRLTGV